jgi:Na+-translocating ferredoxin:NAD+ oxidoreductase RnfG subunit
MKFILIISVMFLSLTGTIREEHRKASDKLVAEVLGKGELVLTESVEGKEYFRYQSDDANTGAIVVFSTASGRFEDFDYMVIINPGKELMNIKILKYRSEYGYEISNKGWLRQFYGKNTGSFRYMADIDALSGATFSARSLTEDINLILAHLNRPINSPPANP